MQTSPLGFGRPPELKTGQKEKADEEKRQEREVGMGVSDAPSIATVVILSHSSLELK